MLQATTLNLPYIKSLSWTLTTHYNVSKIISYNLALGAPGSSLPLVYEGHPHFHALPTYGAIPCISIMGQVHAAMFDFIPGFKGHNHVHGEHYLALKSSYPIPKGIEEVKLETTAKVVDVVKRKTGVFICVEIVTREGGSGRVLCENEWGGFVMKVPTEGAKEEQTDRGERTALYPTPTRKPDSTLTHKTTPEQAALYRAASGDLNALHIDPATAQGAGFKAPILTGTCTVGIAVRHVIEAFADGDASKFGSVRLRLSEPVYAALSEEVRTEMWKEAGGRVLFRMVVDANEVSGKVKTVLNQGCVILKGVREGARL